MVNSRQQNRKRTFGILSYLRSPGARSKWKLKIYLNAIYGKYPVKRI